MVLRTQVKDKIINEVIWNGETSKPGKWKVLVVDNLTLKTVSSVIKMHELATQGIIQVEIIERVRADMPNEAIYFITPTLKNVQAIVKDFKKRKQTQIQFCSNLFF